MTAAHLNGNRPDGHQAVRAALPLPVEGPVLEWPQQHDETVAQEVVTAVRDSIDGDKVIRWLTAVVVLAVAAFAAIVSYSHIFTLGRLHGQDGTAARLLPLSIDGLIAAASLVMLHAGRNKLPVPPLARAMLCTGIGATIAANVLYAVPARWIGPVLFALIGAAISAFPAVAFIGSVEMMIRFVRDARRVATGDIASDTDPRDQRQDDGGDSDDEEDEEDRDERQDERRDSDSDSDNGDRRERQRAPSASDTVAAILRRTKRLREHLASDSTDDRKAAKAELAEKAGVTIRTVERILAELAKTTSKE